jgi:hypothetical protein
MANRNGPLRYQNVLGFARNLDRPHDGLCCYSWRIGLHTIEIQYMFGAYWVTDRYGVNEETQLSEHRCRSPQRAYTVLMRKVVQLGFY